MAPKKRKPKKRGGPVGAAGTAGAGGAAPAARGGSAPRGNARGGAAAPADAAKGAGAGAGAGAAGAAAAKPKVKVHPHAKWLGSFGRRGIGAGEFSDPSHVCVGGDELYVVDSENSRVQVFSISGGLRLLKSFGASGTTAGANAELRGPASCALTADECFVSDTGNNRVVVFRRSDGAFLRAFSLPAPPAPAVGADAKAPATAAPAAAAPPAAAPAPAKAAEQKKPAAGGGDKKGGGRGGSALDPALQKKLLAALAAMGGGDADDDSGEDDDSADGDMAFAGLKSDSASGPNGIAVSRGEVFVADDSAQCLRVYDSAGKPLRVIGGPGTSDAQFSDLIPALAVDGDELFAVDAHRVQVLHRTTGAFVRAFGAKGTGDGQFDEPTGLCVAGARVFVTDGQNGRVQVFDRASGKFLWKFSGAGNAHQTLEFPAAVCVTGDRAFVLDGMRHSVAQLQLVVAAPIAAVPLNPAAAPAAAASAK